MCLDSCSIMQLKVYLKMSLCCIFIPALSYKPVNITYRQVFRTDTCNLPQQKKNTEANYLLWEVSRVLFGIFYSLFVLPVGSPILFHTPQLVC